MGNKLLPMLVVVGFMLSGCGPADPDMVNLRVFSLSAENVVTDAPFNAEDAASAFRILVSGPDMETVSSRDIGMSERQVPIPEYPEGLARQFTVEYLGQGDSGVAPVVGRGRSVPFDVWSDDNGIMSQIFVAPVNSFVRPANIDEQDGNVVSSIPFLSNRLGATMTELDDGRILICGGARLRAGAETWFRSDDLYDISDSCETYSPATGKFVEVPGKMNVRRAYHQALKLGGPGRVDGRVVLIGGYTNVGLSAVSVTPLIDIFDPATGVFTSASNSSGGYGLPGVAGRALFTADVINPGGNIIIVFGGVSNYSSAGATYDIMVVTSDSVVVIGHGPLNGPDEDTGTIRFNHAMVRVSGYAAGRIGGEGYDAYLLIGGENGSGVLETVEPYVIQCDSRAACGIHYDKNFPYDIDIPTTIPGGGRTMIAAAYDRIHNFVYLIGGFREAGGKMPSLHADIFRVVEAEFRDGETLALKGSVGDVRTTELDNGNFLITGGWNGSQFVDTAQVLAPLGPRVVNGSLKKIPDIDGAIPVMDMPRGGHSMITDSTGRVLIFGGVDNGQSGAEPVMYNPKN